MTETWVVSQFESETISAGVQMWSSTPAVIAGVRGYGFARVLCGRAKLSTDPFSVHNVVMVDFERPTRGEKVPVDRPNVQAVRLRGSQLQDHPEVCSLITRQRHMLDIQTQLRYWTNKQAGTSLLLGARVTWAGSHLAVMTGDVDGYLSLELHRSLVRVIRDAVGRDVDIDRLRLLLRRIERNAGMGESDQLDPVLETADGRTDD